MKQRGAAGFCVLVTRPRPQAASQLAAVEASGGSTVLFPVMTIEPRHTVAADIASLPQADIAIFVSSNAVRFGAVAAQGSRVAAIGAATAATLQAAGIAVDILPAAGFNSEALLREAGLQRVAGQRVRIIRGDNGRDLLAKTLTARGAAIDYVSVYRRRKYAATAAELDQLENAWRTGGIDYVIVMSVASLDFLLELLPPWCRQALPDAVLVSPSARVLKTAEDSIPGARVLLADSPDAGDLAAAIAADRQTQTDEMHE